MGRKRPHSRRAETGHFLRAQAIYPAMLQAPIQAAPETALGAMLPQISSQPELSNLCEL